LPYHHNIIDGLLKEYSFSLADEQRRVKNQPKENPEKMKERKKKLLLIEYQSLVVVKVRRSIESLFERGEVTGKEWCQSIN